MSTLLINLAWPETSPTEEPVSHRNTAPNLQEMSTYTIVMFERGIKMPKKMPSFIWMYSKQHSQTVQHSVHILYKPMISSKTINNNLGLYWMPSFFHLKLLLRFECSFECLKIKNIKNKLCTKILYWNKITSFISIKLSHNWLCPFVGSSSAISKCFHGDFFNDFLQLLLAWKWRCVDEYCAPSKNKYRIWSFFWEVL